MVPGVGRRGTLGRRTREEVWEVWGKEEVGVEGGEGVEGRCWVIVGSERWGGVNWKDGVKTVG